MAPLADELITVSRSIIETTRQMRRLLEETETWTADHDQVLVQLATLIAEGDRLRQNGATALLTAEQRLQLCAMVDQYQALALDMVHPDSAPQPD